MENKKMKMSQDTLYKYLTDHNVTISRLSELMGVTPSAVISDFTHRLNRHGNPRCMSVESVRNLNAALPKLAEEIRACAMTFGTEQKYTNRLGSVYDPGMLEPIKHLGKYFNLTKFTERVLGWNRGKRIATITDTMSKRYGHISEEDITKMNIEILSISGFLEGVEVTPDVNAFDGYGKGNNTDEE